MDDVASADACCGDDADVWGDGGDGGDDGDDGEGGDDIVARARGDEECPVRCDMCFVF